LEVKVISAQRAIRLTLGQGLKLFSLAIVALGIEQFSVHGSMAIRLVALTT